MLYAHLNVTVKLAQSWSMDASFPILHEFQLNLFVSAGFIWLYTD